jgi:hypothetical protein
MATPQVEGDVHPDMQVHLEVLPGRDVVHGAELLLNDLAVFAALSPAVGNRAIAAFELADIHLNVPKGIPLHHTLSFFDFYASQCISTYIS